VVVTASRTYRLLVQVTETWRSLPGVEDLGSQTGRLANGSTSHRCDAGEPLEQVQQRTFAGDDLARRPAKPYQAGSRSYGGTIGDLVRHADTAIAAHVAEQEVAYGEPGYDTGLLRDDNRLGVDATSDRPLRADIVGRRVLVQRSSDGSFGGLGRESRGDEVGDWRDPAMPCRRGTNLVGDRPSSRTTEPS
jgi:hypothetical protein